jgi:hypothetical protein
LKTEIEDPNLPRLRVERAEPKFAKSNCEKADPKRLFAKIEKELPNLLTFRKDKEDAIDALSMTDTALPSLEKDRMLRLEPICVKAITDIICRELIRVKPCTDIPESILAKERRLTALPMCMNSKQDVDFPVLMKLRMDREDPTPV